MRNRLFMLALVFALCTPLLAETFPKSRLVDPNGKETEVLLDFRETALLISSKDGKKQLREIPYSEIKTGSRGWESGMWRWSWKVFLSIGTSDSTVVLRLDNGNFRHVITSFEARTGIMVK